MKLSKLGKTLKHLPENAMWWVWRQIRTALYWLRTHTYNRYHIIDLRCPTWGWGYKWGWIDRDNAMFIACFQIFKQFMEEEFYSDAPGAQNDRPIEKEMEEIYLWWTVRRQVNWKAMHDAGYTRERYAALDQQDEEMLTRLMKIRHYLWT